MTVLRSRFAHMGYQTRSFSYPSVHHDLSHNAAQLYAFINAVTAPRIHLVGHSMGGLLALQMLHEHADTRIGRVVLAGSPYHDIHAARGLLTTPLGQTMVGKSIHQWLTQPKPDVSTRYDIGVVAGSRSVGLGRLVANLPTPNDGTITVAETEVPGAKDSILLHVSHSEMLFSAMVAEQAAQFLEYGKFDHEAVK
jgi:pimeloyl-ACP methyl ester carboxylesterase